MNSRKKKNAIQFIILLIVVVLIVGIAYSFMHWRNNRPGPEPDTIHLSATINGNTIDVAPYTACEIGSQCPDGQTTNVDLGEDDMMTITLPESVYDHEWALVRIYDNPAANDQSTYGANQQKSIDVKGSSDPLTANGPRPRLVVAEISSLMIGHDKDGNEAPYTVTWSIHPNGTTVTASIAPESPVENTGTASSTPVESSSGEASESSSNPTTAH